MHCCDSFRRDAASLFFAIGCLLLLPQPVFSGPDDLSWARAKYRQFISDPALYNKGENSFQFEFHVFEKRTEGRLRHWREILQDARPDAREIKPLLDGPVNGVLVLAENGIPFIYGSYDDGVVVTNQEERPLNYVVPDAGYFRSIGRIETLPTGPSLRHDRTSGAWLALDNLVSEFYGTGFDVEGEPRARSIRVLGPRLSYAQLRVTRERRAKQFPITSLFLDCDTSNAHDHPFEVMLTNFYVVPNGLAAGAFPRPIRNIHPNKGTGVFQDAPVKGQDSPVWLREQLKWMEDPQPCEKILSDPKFQAAGKAILERLPATDGFTAEETTRVSQDLARLTAAVRGGASKGDVRAASDALGDLAGFLADRVVSPVRIERWQTPVPTYLAGHERWRTANILEARAGPELAASVYAALRAVVLAAAAPLDLRLRALDLLGEVGVPETSKMLTQLEDALMRGQGKRIPQELDAMFSTVKVRTGVPSDDDVARIKKQLASARTSAIIRGACLEALLLENETGGLEPLIYDTVTAPLHWKLDYPTRCLFAAGLSEEGRNVLQRILVERRPESLFKPVLFLVDTSIRPGDTQWEACQAVVERLALDEHADPDLRLKASQIAARSVEHIAFREKYIRAALRSGNPRFISALGLEDEYLGDGLRGPRYAADFVRAMASPDRGVRAALGTLFARSCHGDWPAEFDEGVRTMLRLLLAENTPRSLENADSLLFTLAMRRPSEARPYIATLVEHARAESDPNKFYGRISAIAVLCKLPLKAPFLPEYYQPCDDGARLIQQHRKELQAQVDAWLKEK